MVRKAALKLSDTKSLSVLDLSFNRIKRREFANDISASRRSILVQKLFAWRSSNTQKNIILSRTWTHHWSTIIKAKLPISMVIFPFLYLADSFLKPGCIFWGSRGGGGVDTIFDNFLLFLARLSVRFLDRRERSGHVFPSFSRQTVFILSHGGQQWWARTRSIYGCCRLAFAWRNESMNKQKEYLKKRKKETGNLFQEGKIPIKS